MIGQNERKYSSNERATVLQAIVSGKYCNTAPRGVEHFGLQTFYQCDITVVNKICTKSPVDTLNEYEYVICNIGAGNFIPAL